MNPVSKDIWTVGDVLKWTTERFKDAGLSSPRLEAEVLLASVLNCDRVTVYTDYQKPLDQKERTLYRELIKKRLEGRPSAYLVGHREFWSLDFKVNPHVLIPRPDTELLVELTLELMKDTASPLIADIGTGSGCIATAIAKERKDATIVATDLSQKALSTAKENAQRHAVNIEFLHGSLTEPLMERAGEFHLVVSNPPYIAEKESSELGNQGTKPQNIRTSPSGGLSCDPDVMKYEPREALMGGKDGLDIIRTLIADVPNILRPGGFFITEVGANQASRVADLMKKTKSYENVDIRQDLSGLDRAVFGKKTEVVSEP